MRLIDADALRSPISNCCESIDTDYWEIMSCVVETIEKSPTIDAVPVCRCYQCRKYHTPDCYAGHEQAAQDFCSHGIPRAPAGSNPAK